jgi:phage/plasmid primase, P4 family, C-terminal domain
VENELNVKSLDLTQFHHFNRNGVATSVFDYAVFEYIIRNYPIFVCGFPYIYQGGVYVPDRSGTKIKQIIRGLLYPEFIRSRVINQVYNLVVEAEELQKHFSELNNHPASYINFKDCMLNVQTMERITHDAKYLSINQIPFRYADIKRAGLGKEIEKFFDFIFSSAEDREMFLEYAGLCFTTDTRQQRFLTMCGLGGTGKSVLIRLLENAVGIGNISNVSMQELSKRFSTSLLVGKTLNSCADLSLGMLVDSSVIKKLLGEDFVVAEYKGKDGFMFKNYSKLLFSTNMLPTITAERTNGFYRRLLILKMDRLPNKPDPELASKLMKEPPYFIYLAVNALHTLYNRGSILVSENSKQAVAQMWKDSDVVQAWLDDCCTVDSNLKIERGKAYNSFNKYCEETERQSLTRNGFFKALRTKNFAEVRGRSERYFTGISFKKVTVKSDGNGEFVKVTDEELAELPFA